MANGATPRSAPPRRTTATQGAAAAPSAEDAASLADRILSSAVSDTADDACLVTIRIL